MVITHLGDVTLTSQEETDVLNALTISWPAVFEVVDPGSSQYLSYIGGTSSDPEALANWKWLGDPEERPSDSALLSAFSTFETQAQADALEEARVAKWEDIVEAEVQADVEDIPGWFSWTEEQAMTWITNNLDPELSSSYPKTLQAITAITRLLIAVRNKNWPSLEGSS